LLDGVKRRTLPLPDRGVDLSLLDWGGDGPLALLHHANGFCAALWAPIAERLRSTFRVVAYDVRGHGESTRPEGREAYRWAEFPEDLLAVADALTGEGGERAVALGIGHSFGGTSMAVAAAARPSLFERIAMLDPVLQSAQDAGVALTEGQNRMAEAARRRRHVWPSAEAVIEAWARNGHPFATWDRRTREIYAREGFRVREDGQVELKCAGEVEATIYEMGGTMDVFGAAPNVRAHVLIVRGTRSHFPRFVFEALADGMPHAALEEIEGSHLLVMEHPDEIAERLLRFAAETKTVRAGVS
jgi:pimeloyl-ACP methyl ester carboxylesterase